VGRTTWKKEKQTNIPFQIEIIVKKNKKITSEKINEISN
jgi:hypothetical protein